MVRKNETFYKGKLEGGKKNNLLSIFNSMLTTTKIKFEIEWQKTLDYKVQTSLGFERRRLQSSFLKK